MDRLIVATLVVAAATAVAVAVQRRRPDAPTQGGWPMPGQVDRADFASPDAPWLVAVFTSATCDSCADVLAKAEPLRGPAVAVIDVEVGRDAELHRRYGIEAVPSLVVADAEGVVRASFVGPPAAGELWSTVAELRESSAGSSGAAEGGW